MLHRTRQWFYESDCQGQTSSVLIAEAFLPWQSALTVAWRTRLSAAIELADLSSSASVLSLLLQRADWACASVRVVTARVRTIVLSETRPHEEAGLTLLRVLREGLRFQQSLGRRP